MTKVVVNKDQVINKDIFYPGNIVQFNGNSKYTRIVLIIKKENDPPASGFFGIDLVYMDGSTNLNKFKLEGHYLKDQFEQCPYSITLTPE